MDDGSGGRREFDARLWGLRNRHAQLVEGDQTILQDGEGANGVSLRTRCVTTEGVRRSKILTPDHLQATSS